MLAIDTNVVVRFLANDDPEQSPKARSLIAREHVFVALTVLLEAEWVLRSGYGLPAGQILAAFRALAGLPQVVVQEPTALAVALSWAEEGMDFADALHLAQSGQSEAFVSFDEKLAKASSRIGAPEVRRP
jgi:predicted nucleic-acid-binding protein